MKINEAGLALVKEFEGCYLNAYKCPAGVWTIGYGHTGSVDGVAIGAGMTITMEKATDLLRQDMAAFEKAVENCSALTFEPNENQFSALVSFAFNCGAGNLKTLVKNRDAATVAEKMLLYNKAAGKVLNGLIRRRKAERELFLTGCEAVQAKGYDGIFPVLPPRGWYQKGDGITTLKDYPTQIKRLQAFLNWAVGANLKEDGKYGSKTREAVIYFQDIYGLEDDGEFGPKSLAMAKSVKK